MNKIISFFHFNFPCGGAERVTIDIANYIVRFAYEVYIFTAFFDAKMLKEGSVQSFIVKLLPDRQIPYSLVNADFMIQCIHDFSIDVFVLPGYNLSTLSYIKSESPSCKFVFAHHGKPLWEVQNKQEWVRRRSQKNTFFKVKWFLIDYPKYFIFKSHRARYIHMYKSIYNVVDAYIVLCEGYKKALIEILHLGGDENRLFVIHNSEKEVLEPPLKKKRRVLYVGRMTYSDKRVDRLLDIWGMICDKVPDWDLFLVGDGEERDKLEKQAAAMNLKNVHFMGYRNDTNRFYQDASVLCLTSSFEGWPLCLTEAQANGVLPIAFNCSEGVEEILSPNGKSGFLISPFNKEKYAETLLGLLQDPRSLEAMRPFVIEQSKRYSIEVVGKEWLSLFNSLSSSDC